MALGTHQSRFTRQADLSGKGENGRMTQFMGTHQNRLDAKGRVSIPASFRNLLKTGDGGVVLVLCPSYDHPCIEGWRPAAFEALSSPLDKLDMYSEGYKNLAVSLFARSCELESDKEGRIVVPEHLKKYAGLTDGVTFLGLGRTFEIWEPAAAEAYLAEVDARAKAHRLTLSGSAA